MIGSDSPGLTFQSLKGSEEETVDLTVLRVTVDDDPFVTRETLQK